MAQSSSGLNPAQVLSLIMALSREGDTTAYHQQEQADREATRRDREAEAARTAEYQRLELEMRAQAERDRQRLEGWNVYNAQLGRQQQTLRDLEAAQRNAYEGERQKYDTMLRGLPKTGGISVDKLDALKGQLNWIEQQIAQDIKGGNLTASTDPKEYLTSLAQSYKTAMGTPYGGELNIYLPAAVARLAKGASIPDVLGSVDNPAKGSVMEALGNAGVNASDMRQMLLEEVYGLHQDKMGDPAAIKSAREAMAAMQANPEAWVAAHMGGGMPSAGGVTETNETSGPPSPHQVRVAGTISDSAGHHYAIPLAQEGSEQLIGPIRQGLVGLAGDEDAIANYNARGGGSLKPGDLLPQTTPITETQVHDAGPASAEVHGPALIHHVADLMGPVIEAGEKAFGGAVGGGMGQPVPGKPGYIYGDPGMGGGIIKAPSKEVSLVPQDLLQDAGHRLFEGPHREEIAANLRGLSPEYLQHFVHTAALWHGLHPDVVAQGIQGLLGGNEA